MSSTKRMAYEIAEFKAIDGEGALPGAFKAVVSVFNNVDLQGDRVMPGAFAKSIATWKKSSDPIPVIWSHEWSNPAAHIGFINPSKIYEDPKVGLVVEGQIDVDDDNPFAKQVFRLLKERRVKQWSFAYDVGGESRASDGANNLTELSIIEVGPTLKGANPETMTLAAKSLEQALHEWEAEHGEKAGRRLSASTVAEIHSLADDIGKLQERVRKLVGETDDGAEGDGGDGKAVHYNFGKPTMSDGKTPMTKHDFADTNNDGKCDVCGYSQADHDTAQGDLGKAEDPLLVKLDVDGNVIEPDPEADGTKAAIGSHKTATDKGSWDGAANEKNVTSPNDSGTSYFNRIYAWRASDGDPKVKASYRFPHHDVSGDGTPGAAVVAACQAGIAVLNGGRGGTTIPAADQKGVYNHLASHLRDAGVEPPALKQVEGDGAKGAEHETDQEPGARSGDLFDNESLHLRARIAEMLADQKR